MQATLPHRLVNPLTLDALQGSILSPYCEGFTWINLNQKDLPKENHICLTVNLQKLDFPNQSTVLLYSSSWQRHVRQGGNSPVSYIFEYQQGSQSSRDLKPTWSSKL